LRITFTININLVSDEILRERERAREEGAENKGLGTNNKLGF